MKVCMKKIAVALLACSLSGGAFAQSYSSDLSSIGSFLTMLGQDTTAVATWSQHVNMGAVNGVLGAVETTMRTSVDLPVYARATRELANAGVPSDQAQSIVTSAVKKQISTEVTNGTPTHVIAKVSSDPIMNKNQLELMSQIKAIPANHAADIMIQLNSGATAADIKTQGPAFFAAIKATLAQIPNRNIAVNAFVDTNQLSSKAGLAAVTAGLQQLHTAFPNSSNVYYSGKPPAISIPGVTFQPASPDMVKTLQNAGISDSMVNVAAVPGQAIKQSKMSSAPTALMKSLDTPNKTSVPAGLRLIRDSGDTGVSTPNQVPTQKSMPYKNVPSF